MNILEDYKHIGGEIDTFFEKYFQSPSRLVKFIYDELTVFVLLDKSNQTCALCHDLIEAYKFLASENFPTGDTLLYNFFLLITKECELRTKISEMGFIPKVIHSRKLEIVRAHLEALYSHLESEAHMENLRNGVPTY